MSRVSSAGRIVLITALVAASIAAWPQIPAYPMLGSLGPEDVIFAQQQAQLSESYKAIRAGEKPPELVIYSYAVQAPIDLFSIAARLNMPYETLATINRLDRSRTFLPGERILVPSAPGIFASLAPGSDLDLLFSYRAKDSGFIVRVAGEKSSVYRFYPGARFLPEEEALFRGLLIHFPLPSEVLVTGFEIGESRADHRMAHHAGIDLMAPAGTEVYAARAGLVTGEGSNEVFGQYIIITHDGNWSTVYGHLSARLVRLNDSVESGMILANLGSTGESTGSYLHFEVRMPQGR